MYLIVTQISPDLHSLWPHKGSVDSSRPGFFYGAPSRSFKTVQLCALSSACTHVLSLLGVPKEELLLGHRPATARVPACSSSPAVVTWC